MDTERTIGLIIAVSSVIGGLAVGAIAIIMAVRATIPYSGAFMGLGIFLGYLLAMATGWDRNVLTSALGILFGGIGLQPGVKVVWFLKNTYFLVPLPGAWLFSKIYKLRAAG